MCADTPEVTTEADYKDTLFLPRTDFPMRAGLPQREPGWLGRWERIGIYDRLREKTGREPFILHDGPPYANGHLHIGHALNKTIKDMVVRSHQMMGHDARYVPGWDCHGLPIEWKIEEQYRAKGLDKDAVDTIAFRRECRKFAEEWVSIQREEFKRLGVIGAWENPYLTMAFHAEAVIADEFMKFLMNGALYRGSKPVMWSSVEKTALAEAEVEYHDHTSHTVWVKFPLKTFEVGFDRDTLNAAGNQTTSDTSYVERMDEIRRVLFAADHPSYVVIWTTTPWTIPQNRAVAFNPNIDYGLYEIEEAPEGAAAQVGQRLILSDRLAEETLRAGKVTSYRKVCAIPSDALENIVLNHPFHAIAGGINGGGEGEWDYAVPMLPGEHVTDDAGTGFVHTAPSHGDEDYQLGLKFNLPMTYNVEPDGTYRADLPLFAGQAIILPNGKEGPANVSVIKALASVGALFAKGKLKHSYPHSWRSKAPLIFRNTPQWFAAIDRPLEDGLGTYGETIRTRALASIDQLVTFTPVSGQNRLRSMMLSRPDWVLSRQRAWGVPLTCFIKKGAKPEDADFLLRDPEVNARITRAFESEGADVWYRPGFKAEILNGLHDPEAYEQIFDVLDVWFDSGSTHAFVLRDRADGVPDGIADVYLEGTDQHRGWFHSSMLQGCGTMGRAPYRNVVTHGFTLDEKGMKMSKSLGNTIVPAKVIEQYGADILRLWVAQADYTADQRIGPEILKGTADSYRRLRNTLRFLLGALSGFEEAERVEPAAMPELERFILHRLAELDGIVRDGYARFDFQRVFQQLFQFCTVDLSALYFDIRKDSLYCDPADAPRRRAARTVLDLLFHRLVTWLAPILPFTMEEVWLDRFPSEDGSVHLQDFPHADGEWFDPELALRWETIRRARRVVTGALEVERREKRIGASLEAAPRVFVADPETAAILASVPFAELCITSGLTLETGPAPEGAFALDDTPGIAVVPAPAPGEKCARCWRILPDVGTHAHAETCERCDEALS